MRRLLVASALSAGVLTVGTAGMVSAGSLQSGACVGLSSPVPGASAAGFSPAGSYAGHWGIDYLADHGAVVRSAAGGVVSFSGIVVGNRTVTIDHGGGLKTSYSYLDSSWVGRGSYVERGRGLGTAGHLHGTEVAGVHFSTRIDGWYVDPAGLLGCPDHRISDALRLVPWRPRALAEATPKVSAVRRGILGGTFDPIHQAHLVAGEVAFRQLDLDVVTFVPAGAPWQKADLGVTDRHHRWEMTRRAIEGVEYFEADDREIVRDGWTYTADTLAGFDDDELYLILGADAAAGLRSWDRPDAVLARAIVAVMPRPGTSIAAVRAAVGEDAPILDMPLLDISGTDIRARWREGRPVRFLVPEPVYHYAAVEGLYE